MTRPLFTSCVLSVFVPVMAQAATPVYPGCSIPAVKAGRHIFYVDPVKGSPDGDGSIAKPWKTLSDVIGPTGTLLSTLGHKKAGGGDPLSAVNPNGPIKAGDAVMLMSGNHGAVTIQNAFNSDFITVMAAPGETPVISSLAVKSASKWLFQGIKFQGQDPGPPPAKIGSRGALSLVTLGRGEWLGQSSDIVFTSSSFSTTDSVSGWSDTDWLVKPYLYALNIAVPCVSVSGSKFFNLVNAIGITKPNVLAVNNVISGFSVDALEVTAGNVTIKGNTIKNNVSPAAINPWHPDGIQGWSQVVNGVIINNDNVNIDGNTIIKTGDPTKTWMQGISIFNGKWSNLVIQNNVVVTNHWHGIAVYGATSVKILNNTVLAALPNTVQTWIRVDKGSDGTVPTSAIVRNNIATNLVLPLEKTIFDHNEVWRSYTAMISGKVRSVLKSDIASKTTVNALLSNDFASVDYGSGTFDLRLKPGASVIGTGTAVGAPAIDILGKARGSSVDRGAYQH